MKLTRTIAAGAFAAALTMTLTACGGDDADTTGGQSSSSSTTSTSQAAQLPTAADLNAILATAVDPAASKEEKVKTVEGGEQAPELFDVLAKSKAESGAEFEVVNPVLPGYEPDSVLATVKFNLPDGTEQLFDDVKFVNEGGDWKLSQLFACTLVSNVAPAELPKSCEAVGVTPAPAPGGEAPAPAPAPGGAEAPAPAPAPAG